MFIARSRPFRGTKTLSSGFGTQLMVNFLLLVALILHIIVLPIIAAVTIRKFAIRVTLSFDQMNRFSGIDHQEILHKAPSFLR